MPAVLVTGASSGIGEACALHLDGLGHRVFAGVRRAADGDRLQAGASDRLHPVHLDVTDQASIDDAVAVVAAHLGTMRFAGLVNNAGIAVGGPIEYLPIADWRHQLEVNVIGQVAVTKAFLPLLREGQGRIVFIGSIGGRNASPMLGPYSASKFALEAVADSLRQELHEWGLEVALVEPGAVRTPIWEKGRGLASQLERSLPSEAVERYARFIEITKRGIEFQEGHGVAPEVVARAVEHALDSRRPRTRYVVGNDAKLQALAARLLPDRVRDAGQRLLLGRI